jgi:cell division protein FtsN
MDEQLDDYAALKRRLLGRIVFAVVVLAGLLASLAVFDRINEPPPPEKPLAKPSAPPPAAVAALPDLIKSVEPPKDDKSLPVATSEAAPAVPEASAAPKGLSPLSAPGEKPLTQPASGRHVLMRSAEPTASKPMVPEATKGTASQSGAAPAKSPPAHVAESADARPATPTAAKPYALQLGVFSDVANAEELRARLEKAGIRASIEARVQVGPFSSKAEADAARAKLKELGIADAMLLSLKGRKSH